MDASIGKTMATQPIPTPLPMTTWKQTVLEVLLSTRSVVRSPPPMMMRIQPTYYISIKYWPVFLAAMPATGATRLRLYDKGTLGKLEAEIGQS